MEFNPFLITQRPFSDNKEDTCSIYRSGRRGGNLEMTVLKYC